MENRMTEDVLTAAFVQLQRRGRTRAEDALQEAFCRLWGRDYSFRTVQQATAMLLRTSRNITIDEIRSRNRRPTVSLDERIGIHAEETDSARERETLFRQVEASIEQELTDKQKTIIRLHEYEGETLESIAHELGMQPAAVRMQISRARKLLRDKFRKEYENI